MIFQHLQLCGKRRKSLNLKKKNAFQVILLCIAWIPGKSCYVSRYNNGSDGVVTCYLNFILGIELKEMRPCVRKLQGHFWFTVCITDFIRWHCVQIVDYWEESIPKLVQHDDFTKECVKLWSSIHWKLRYNIIQEEFKFRERKTVGSATEYHYFVEPKRGAGSWNFRTEYKGRTPILCLFCGIQIVELFSFFRIDFVKKLKVFFKILIHFSRK